MCDLRYMCVVRPICGLGSFFCMVGPCLILEICVLLETIYGVRSFYVSEPSHV